MSKRFKLRISRVIPSFHSCRSKDPSTLPSNPVPSFLQFSFVNPNPITLNLNYPHQTSKHHHFSFKRHVSSAITSIACGCGSRSTTKYLSETDHTESPPTPEFHWEKEDKFHVVAKVFDETPRQKIYNSSASASGDTSCDDDVLLPPPPLPNTEKKKRRGRKKKKIPQKTRISTSSADTELFSSESYDDNDNVDDEESETLVSSSRSLSNDSSSEFYPRLETIREVPFNRLVSTRKKKKVKKVKRCILKTSQVITKNDGLSSPEIESPARLSMFLQRLIPCTVDGKVRESFAVVKKSEDPYQDFKGSMLEMILEKQMFDEKDLEQLLHCFLSLNSRHHHRVIVEAFTEIWDALFYGSGSFRVSRAL